MLGRSIRVVLFVATALVVWLVASPARAAEPPVLASSYAPEESRDMSLPAGVAPLCDYRGATMLAPPPIVQGPESAIDVDETPVACVVASLEKTLHPSDERGHGDADPLDGAPFALPTLATHVVGPDRSLLQAPSENTAHPPGVRDRVDRPPRA